MLELSGDDINVEITPSTYELLDKSLDETSPLPLEEPTPHTDLGTNCLSKYEERDGQCEFVDEYRRL